MCVAPDRRRAYLGIPDAGNQCRAALPGANTRSACRTAAVRPRRGRLFLRRRVRGHLPRSDGEDGAGTPRAFRHRADRGRDRPAGGCQALFGRGEGVACILGTGSNSCWCRGGEIVENVPPLGYVLGDEGSGAALGRNLVNGIFKGHIPCGRSSSRRMG